MNMEKSWEDWNIKFHHFQPKLPQFPQLDVEVWVEVDDPPKLNRLLMVLDFQSV